MADKDAEKPQPQEPQGRSEYQLTKLAQENQALREELASVQRDIVAEKGPPAGTFVCFQRQGEGFCRPAVIVSQGFTEHVKAPGGTVARHALIEYGEAPWTLDPKAPEHMRAHGFQTDRPWDPSGKPETWHSPAECPRQNGPGCPFAKKPEWPARSRT